MMEQLKRAWRLFLAAPSEPFNRSNFNGALLKLYNLDQTTKQILDDIGLEVNRPGIFGGSNSDVDWSHDEQDDEQIQP